MNETKWNDDGGVNVFLLLEFSYHLLKGHPNVFSFVLEANEIFSTIRIVTASSSSSSMFADEAYTFVQQYNSVAANEKQRASVISTDGVILSKDTYNKIARERERERQERRRNRRKRGEIQCEMRVCVRLRVLSLITNIEWLGALVLIVFSAFGVKRIMITGWISRVQDLRVIALSAKCFSDSNFFLSTKPISMDFHNSKKRRMYMSGW